jgi:hypothetical protein
MSKNHYFLQFLQQILLRHGSEDYSRALIDIRLRYATDIITHGNLVKLIRFDHLRLDKGHSIAIWKASTLACGQ